MPKRTIYRCSKCGSKDVHSGAWTSMNDEAHVITFEQKHCADCEGECSVTETEVECDAEGEVHA